MGEYNYWQGKATSAEVFQPFTKQPNIWRKFFGLSIGLLYSFFFGLLGHTIAGQKFEEMVYKQTNGCGIQISQFAIINNIIIEETLSKCKPQSSDLIDGE